MQKPKLIDSAPLKEIYGSGLIDAIAWMLLRTLSTRCRKAFKVR